MTDTTLPKLSCICPGHYSATLANGMYLSIFKQNERIGYWRVVVKETRFTPTAKSDVRFVCSSFRGCVGYARRKGWIA